MSGPTEPQHILWLDLETAGLAVTDPILEIATVVTDMQLNEPETGSRVQAVVRPPRDNRSWLQNMHHVALEMHVNSGLIAEVREAKYEIEQIDHDIATGLQACYPDEIFALGGSGVAHFDRAVIRQQMPFLSSLLTYWCIDVGNVRRFATRVMGVNFERTEIAHRAMPDVEQSIAEAKRLRTILDPAALYHPKAG